MTRNPYRFKILEDAILTNRITFYQLHDGCATCSDSNGELTQFERKGCGVIKLIAHKPFGCPQTPELAEPVPARFCSADHKKRGIWEAGII